MRRAAAAGGRAAGGAALRAACGGAGLSPPREPAASDTARVEPADMEHFIETVRKYPCLWNTTAIEYRDQELKDAAWAEVMKETDLSSVKEVKLKWKKLRDSYRDALKRQNEMLAKDGGGGAAKRAYPWKYMGLMQFLQPYMSARKKPAEPPYPPPAAPENGHAANGAAADGRSSDDSDSDAESSPKRKNCEQLTVIDRKLDYLCKVQSKRPPAAAAPEAAYGERRRDLASPAAPDPLDIFFNSMCQSTKRFPFTTQIKIKRTLFNAVIEAEEALLAEQQSYASLWAAGPASSSSSEPDAADDDDVKPS